VTPLDGQQREALEGLSLWQVTPPRGRKLIEAGYKAALTAQYELFRVAGEKLQLREEELTHRESVIEENERIEALAVREEPQDLGEPDAALVWRAARAMWEAGPTTSRRGWEDLSDRQREFAYNEARAAVGVVFVAVREADYDPDRDKRPYSELSETQRIARERASLKRQLDAVDRELKWAGTGRGRIQSIRALGVSESPEGRS
jgi:hypothetical protein